MNATLIRLAIGAAIAAALFAAYTWQKAHWIDYGKAQMELQYKANHADNLREGNREYARLVEAVQVAQVNYEKLAKHLQDLSARLDTGDERMRKFTATLPGLIGNASTDSLRRYAEAIGADSGRLRNELRRFGTEAAQCSATAYTLQAANEALRARLATCTVAPTPAPR